MNRRNQPRFDPLKSPQVQGQSCRVQVHPQLDVNFSQAKPNAAVRYPAVGPNSASIEFDEHLGPDFPIFVVYKVLFRNSNQTTEACIKT